MNKNEGWIKSILIHLGLVLLASVFFALSFPNPLFKHGFPLIAWFSLIPALAVVARYSIPACAAWGAIYGFTSYSLFNFWLSAFHPLAGIITSITYMIFLAIVFVFFKLAIVFFPKRGYLVQWLIFLTYEYLCTKGFLGYPYGVMGYSQWKMIPLIQIASITGVWGISALVTFPSFYIAGVLNQNSSRQDAENAKNAKEEKRIPQTMTWRPLRALRLSEKLLSLNFFDKMSILCWLVVLIVSLVFGFVNMKDYSAYPKADIALVQHNTDPWEATKAPHSWQVTESYKRDLANLIRLSDAALASEPKPQMIVWPETAFIPRIYWHYTYRDDPNTWPIVRDLLTYLFEQEIPFLIGNDDARRDSSINSDASAKHRVDYNAAMFFEDGLISAYYRKMHLVPFTEYFPYRKQFPWIYKWLENADTHFWEKGEEETIFEGPGFTFASPICFEDAFGYISANFVRKGADVLIGMTNDAWSKSLTAQNQHLSMAVFRAIENNRPMVRSTTSGQTCAIDPNGRVIAEAPPFTQVHLNVSVPLVKGETLYTRYTDYFAVFLAILTGIMFIFGTVYCTIRLKREPK